MINQVFTAHKKHSNSLGLEGEVLQDVWARETPHSPSTNKPICFEKGGLHGVLIILWGDFPWEQSSRSHRTSRLCLI